MRDPALEAHRAAPRLAVHSALAPHGTGAASLDEAATEDGMWGIDIRASARGAARAYLAQHDGDEVVLGFGHTHIYLWDDDPEVLAARVHAILAAVFSGRVREAGRPGDGFAKVTTANGELLVGAMHLHLPWRWRRIRAYEPYSMSG